MFFCDAYADRPTSQRDKLVEEIRRLRVVDWSDDGNVDIRNRIAALEAALKALDAQQ
jgi:hypothetical protein